MSARVVSGTAGGHGNGAAEAQLSQVQGGNKGIDDTDQCIGRDIILNARWKQTGLISRCTFNELRGYIGQADQKRSDSTLICSWAKALFRD